MCEKQMPAKKVARRRVLISRKKAAKIYFDDCSVDTLQRMEAAGKLTPIRLTGPNGHVKYNIDELEALARGE